MPVAFWVYLIKTKFNGKNFKKGKIKISKEYILKKIDDRLNARKNGKFDLADKIRKELLDNGIEIEDQKIKQPGNINE